MPQRKPAPPKPGAMPRQFSNSRGQNSEKPLKQSQLTNITQVKTEAENRAPISNPAKAINIEKDIESKDIDSKLGRL